MTFLRNIEEATRLLKEAAETLEERGVLKLDFEIKIKAQLPHSTVILNADPGENLPPSK